MCDSGEIFVDDIMRRIETVLRHAIFGMLQSDVDIMQAMTEDGMGANSRRVQPPDKRQACLAFTKNGTPAVPRRPANERGIDRTSIMTGIYRAGPGAGVAVDHDVSEFINSIKIE
jgi:hypothetical protein